MSNFKKTAKRVTFGTIATIGALMATGSAWAYQSAYNSTLPSDELIASSAVIFGLMGVALISVSYNYGLSTAQERAAKTDAGGVHAIWWILWLILFFPALIIVAIVHNGRKNRSVIRELKAGLVAPVKASEG